MGKGFTVYIDMPDTGQAAKLAKIVRNLGGDVHLGATDEITPDVVVATHGRAAKLEKKQVWGRAGPAVIAWAEIGSVDVRSLLKLRVCALLDPSSKEEEISETLERVISDLRVQGTELDELREMEVRYREISTIIRLSLEIGIELDVSRVLEMIVQQISQDLGYEIVSIMLLDEESRYLTIKAARGLGDKIIKSARVELGKGVSGIVAQTGDPLLIRDIENDVRFQKLKSHGRYSSKSLICVPLKVGDRVIGVLNGNNKKTKGDLGSHDLRLLSVFAAQASVSIERARLYRSLELQAEEVEKAYERLQELDRVKSDFITNVSHEFRTPVTVMLGYLEILKGSLTDNDQIEKVDIALESALKLSAFVEDSTDILKLDTGAMHFDFTKVAVDVFLEEITRKFWGEFSSRGIELIVDISEGLPEVYVDVEKVTKVFNKLLDNSLKFTPEGGYTKVACTNSNDDGIKVLIEDSGPGIPRAEHETVFERFEQSGDILTSKPAGTGLGLSIARAIVAQHGGTLSIDESFMDGCRVYFNLPAHLSNKQDDGSDT